MKFLVIGRVDFYVRMELEAKTEEELTQRLNQFTPEQLAKYQMGPSQQVLDWTQTSPDLKVVQDDR